MTIFGTPLRLLPTCRNELNLTQCLCSGQSFRWRAIPAAHVTRFIHPADYMTKGNVDTREWAFARQHCTVVLRQGDEGVLYRCLFFDHHDCVREVSVDETRSWLIRYLQLDVNLMDKYQAWRDIDSHFKAKIHDGYNGIRILAQDPWETLVCFICSSNNNIRRITLMIDRLCHKYGTPVPHPSLYGGHVLTDKSSLDDPGPTLKKEEDSLLPPGDLKPSIQSSPPITPKKRTYETTEITSSFMFSMPTPQDLSSPEVETELRNMGFGYRGKFVQRTAAALVGKGQEYVLDKFAAKEPMTEEQEQMAREELLSFMGVGPKVADCIMLFSLGYRDVVPVDTHVFQIAMRDYGLRRKSLPNATPSSPACQTAVQSHLRNVWGSYAGWCQQVLFFTDLSSIYTPELELTPLTPKKSKTTDA